MSDALPGAQASAAVLRRLICAPQEADAVPFLVAGELTLGRRVDPRSHRSRGKRR
jgi:hypothetical protein